MFIEIFGRIRVTQDENTESEDETDICEDEGNFISMDMKSTFYARNIFFINVMILAT